MLICVVHGSEIRCAQIRYKKHKYTAYYHNSEKIPPRWLVSLLRISCRICGTGEEYNVQGVEYFFCAHTMAGSHEPDDGKLRLYIDGVRRARVRQTATPV